MKMKEGVTPHAAEVDPTSIDAVPVWIEKMGASGMLSRSVRRNWGTAMKGFLSVLRPEEPRAIAHVQGQVENVVRRWLNLKGGHPGSGRAYVERVNKALREYLQYQQDPLRYQAVPGRKSVTNSSPRTNSKTVSSPSTPRSSAQKESIQPIPSATPSPERAAEPKMTLSTAAAEQRSFPLGPSRTFVYSLPRGEFTSKDVLKISCHLLTFANDFDPGNKAQAQVFALSIPRDSDGKLAP
jgi:hypothetical protein